MDAVNCSMFVEQFLGGPLGALGSSGEGKVRTSRLEKKRGSSKWVEKIKKLRENGGGKNEKNIATNHTWGHTLDFTPTRKEVR